MSLFYNNQFNILEANVSTITSQININGVSFEGLPSDFATIADLCNINLTIDNLDQNFVLLSEFIELLRPEISIFSGS